MAFNRCILQGRLVRNPETRQTSSGTSVANFTLAVDRGFGEDKKTDFIPVVAFKGIADTIGKYVTKGQLVLIGGQLQTKEWEDKEGNKRTGFEVLAQEFTFCETRACGTTNTSTETQSVVTGKLEPVSGGDDLPF